MPPAHFLTVLSLPSRVLVLSPPNVRPLLRPSSAAPLGRVLFSSQTRHGAFWDAITSPSLSVDTFINVVASLSAPEPSIPLVTLCAVLNLKRRSTDSIIWFHLEGFSSMSASISRPNAFHEVERLHPRLHTLYRVTINPLLVESCFPQHSFAFSLSPPLTEPSHSLHPHTLINLSQCALSSSLSSPPLPLASSALQPRPPRLTSSSLPEPMSASAMKAPCLCRSSSPVLAAISPRIRTRSVRVFLLVFFCGLFLTRRLVRGPWYLWVYRGECDPHPHRGQGDSR